jgi:putative membrane-bound dehydrogenase-like protein
MKSQLCRGLVVSGLLINALPVAAAPAKPLFTSPLVTPQTPGHAVEIDVDVSGVKTLFLVATDGGDGFGADWADWVDPRLLGDFGEKNLTELKWKSANVGWGRPNRNKNAQGGPLRVDGREVSGIAAHAPSVLEFELPEGTKRFLAKGALDEGGSKQGTSSVIFIVTTERPALPRRARAPSGAQSPEEALAGLEVAPGLEATIFATEPMLLSPSAIDIDVRGRVWVAEIVNYRGHNGKRPEGDRILILEDTDNDGRADKQTVFYQNPAINSPHGVCVLGNKVIVSALGAIHVLTDENHDDLADRRELMFTGIGGSQHDHGAHQFMFGPDGRLYFNIGNAGDQLRDKNGQPIIDLAGNEISQHRKPYQQGLVFRCDLDGSNVETLGWNFRNNWEVAVDSFGTIWQSDNDDDGNRGVRINYVMEFGNFGYNDELTGAGWQSPRSNMETEIPLRHWHLNDPGVVPNLLQTGGGSPTGIMVYEGTLLPAPFRNQLIHCDAGPNVVRAYPAKNNGAGYSAEMVNMLEGVRDKWFRPSDVVAAPDGSLIVADWYDPGVGGHGMGDLDRGRLYRLAPPGARHTVPSIDLSTPEGAAAALKSPNLAVRYDAFTALRKFGNAAEPALKELWGDENPRFRARALWLLGRLDGSRWVKAALAEADPDLRIAGIRLARQLDLNVLGVARKLAGDTSPQVRRECAIALRHQTYPGAAVTWAQLAAQHDGADRWYLEALGIGADKNWDACLEAWLALIGGEEKALGSVAGRDIIWRSRGARSVALIARLVADPVTPAGERPRYVRALDFQPANTRQQAIEPLLPALATGDTQPILVEVIQKLPSFDYAKAPASVKSSVTGYLGRELGSDAYFDFVSRFGVRDQAAPLLELVVAKPSAPGSVRALKQLIEWNEIATIEKTIATAGEKAAAIIRSLGATGAKPAVELLQKFTVSGERPVVDRVAAVEALGRSRGGELGLLELAKADRLPAELRPAAGKVLGGSRDEEIRGQAQRFLAQFAQTPEGIQLPPIAELCRRTGDIASGRTVYITLCQSCHQIGGEGTNFGPALSEIGSKLPREGLYASILDPSQAINFGFEGWQLETKDGTILAGMITSETDRDLTVRTVGGINNKLKKSDVTKREKMSASLMPPLAAAITEKQIVDLVEFLSTQRKK